MSEGVAPLPILPQTSLRQARAHQLIHSCIHHTTYENTDFSFDLVSSLLNCASEGASAVDAGSEFQIGIVLTMKLNLKTLVFELRWQNFLEWLALVLADAGVA